MLALSMLQELHESDPDVVSMDRSGLRAEKVILGDDPRIRYRLEFVPESKTEEWSDEHGKQSLQSKSINRQP